MLMRSATVVQVCKCRTCFMFYCMFYFTCDRPFSSSRLASQLSLIAPVVNANKNRSYLTLYLTLCGLTGEPITLWGWGLSRLVHEMPALVCHSSPSLDPLEGIDSRCIHHFLVQTIPASYHPVLEENFLLPLIHPGFSNFNVWPQYL